MVGVESERERSNSKAHAEAYVTKGEIEETWCECDGVAGKRKTTRGK